MKYLPAIYTDQRRDLKNVFGIEFFRRFYFIGKTDIADPGITDEDRLRDNIKQFAETFGIAGFNIDFKGIIAFIFRHLVEIWQKIICTVTVALKRVLFAFKIGIKCTIFKYKLYLSY
jgi:hypothetical protein